MFEKSNNLYHSVAIGKLQLMGNLFLAPVAGYSDCAFRFVCLENGANFTYTEMVSSEALVRGSEKTRILLKRAENESAYGVQIFGGDPEVMAKATTIVLNHAKPNLIDINAGCPVPKITKTGAGSALTRDSAQLFKITNAVVNAVDSWCKTQNSLPIPVTIKIRSGWDSTPTWKEAALAGFDAGCSAITLHPRTRAQGYEGKANWDYLGELSALYAGKIPVFGSGDIFSPEDARNMLEQTRCDAVMFARGAMGNPFIFSEAKNYLLNNTYEKTLPIIRIQTGLRELDFLIAEKGEVSACREMRKRFCAYSKGIERGNLLRNKIVSASTKEDYKKIFSELPVENSDNS